MPDVGKILKSEISRLARKEANKMTAGLSGSVQDLKKQLRHQREEIADLHKALATKMDRRDEGKISPELTQKKSAAKVRVSAGSIKTHRKRLKLSQKQLAQLVGVTTITVSNWERGKSTPRGDKRDAVAILRGMGLKEVKQRLKNIQS